MGDPERSVTLESRQIGPIGRLGALTTIRGFGWPRFLGDFSLAASSNGALTAVWDVSLRGADRIEGARLRPPPRRR